VIRGVFLLKQYILNNWEKLINDKKPSFFNIATISSCNEDYGNDLALLFVENCKAPQYFLKVVRDSKYNFKLKRENFALTTLSKSILLKNLLPVVFSSGYINGRYFFIQSGISGQNLHNLLFSTGLNDKTLELIEQSILLLSNINMASRQISGIKNSPHMLDQNVLSLAQMEYSSFGISGDDFNKIIAYQDYFKTLGRRFFLHGDFWPANILVDEKNGKVTGVIDWEFSTPCSAVPTDIIWFLINLSYSLSGYIHSSNTLEESFKWGFFLHGEHNSVFKKYFQLYMSKIDLPGRSLFKPLLLLSLCDMAMREKIAYGRHSFMDNDCLDLLKYAIKHDSYLENL